MSDDLARLAADVRQVFLVPAEFSEVSRPLSSVVEALPESLRSTGLAFEDSLRSVLRTLSIPFQYTVAQVESLHHQRFVMAERIRALPLPGEDETQEERNARAQRAIETARTKYSQFAAGDGREVIPGEVLSRLAEIKDNTESLAAARELMRQGVVLVWSAFEVLARDLFVEVLNRQPARVETLLASPANRKRFGIEKLDWGTLASFGFDISRNLGTILAERADLDDMRAIKDAYGAMFNTNGEASSSLADPRLWLLFQRRCLIVHRRGIVDQQYLEKTGEALAVGSQLWPAPKDIEAYLEAVLAAGTKLLSTVDTGLCTDG